ncbi:hypothetical protein FACS1894166_07390 [Bacilli bacterium]|nr:hypothetical protein FACS1894166_07390 [Bacilli bacterium]
MFAFMCIGCAQIGALINRKTKRVKVERTKSFVPCAIISIIIVSISLLFIIVSSFADIGFDIAFIHSRHGIPNKLTKDILIGDVLTITVLFVLTSITFIPPLIQRRHWKKVA